jgi:hypothetical protein
MALTIPLLQLLSPPLQVPRYAVRPLQRTRDIPRAHERHPPAFPTQVRARILGPHSHLQFVVVRAFAAHPPCPRRTPCP